MSSGAMVAPSDGAQALLREPAPRLGSTVRELLAVAVPNIAGYVLTLINELVNTLFLGHTGDKAALGAVGLANMMQNCVGLSIGFGIASVLDTLVSQAHGAQQHELSCHQLQRCRVLLVLQLFWMLPLLWFSGDLLSVIHEDAEVARKAGEYNQASVFGFFAVLQHEATRKFLCNREDTTTPCLIAVVTSVFHVGWCALFVLHFRLGNAGAGYANCVTWWTQFLLGLLYLGLTARRHGFRRRAVLWIERAGLREWGAYTRLAIPATLQLCAEWWFWEITALIVGYLGKNALAAHVTTINWVALSFMPAVGISCSSATLVGNALGANLPRKAKIMAWTCEFMNLGVWACIAAFMVLGREPLSLAYSDDDEIRTIMKRLLCIFAVAGFFDSSQSVLGGTLRGIGRQSLAAIVYIIVYYGIMLPGGVAAAFWMNFGIYGIWGSFGVGTSIAFAVFVVELCRTNWPQLAAEASERMEAEGLRAQEADKDRANCGREARLAASAAAGSSTVA